MSKGGLTLLQKSLVALVVASIIMILSVSTNSKLPGPNPGADIISILDTDVEGTTKQLEGPPKVNIFRLHLIYLCEGISLPCLRQRLEGLASQHLATMALSYTQITD